jgi:hypothetical protein
VRTYLVVIDDSAEARVALRFAARRAAKTKGNVEVLAVVPPQDFVQWGGVQAAFEEEQKLRIEGVVSSAVGEIFDEAGIKPAIVLRQGDAVKSKSGPRLSHRPGRNRGFGARRCSGWRSGTTGRPFHRKGCREDVVPGDDHPRLDDRREAGAAQLVAAPSRRR